MGGILSDGGGGRQQGRVGSAPVKRASWPPQWALAAVLSVAGAAGCKGNAEPGKAAASAAPAASAGPVSRTVRLDRRPSAIGEKRRIVKTSFMKLSVEFWQENEKLATNESVRNESYDRTLDVLGLVGGVPSKGSVHYEKYRREELTAEKPPVDTAELQGKTYLLDATEGKLSIHGDKGKDVPKAEADELRRLHGDLGKDDPVVGVIGDAPITLGQPLSMRKELLRALMTAESGELDSGRIWLEEIQSREGRDVAIFKWTADTHSREQNGLEVKWHMSGEAQVALSPAVTLSASLKGSLDVSGETTQRGGRVNLAGAGSISDESTLTVTRP
jgi:hypothetical protein